MRAKAWLGGFLALSVIALSGTAMAVPSDMDIIVTKGTWGTTGGGEFNIDVLDNTTPDFVSFCLELSEGISYGGKYGVLVSAAADWGGGGGINPDPISTYTAYLYSSFVSGLYELTNDAQANGFQQAIWYFENEMSAITSGAAFYVTEAKSNANGTLYNVQVMNLYGYSKDGQINLDDKKQSMLKVPEPGTLLLLGSGLLGLGILRRRRVV